MRKLVYYVATSVDGFIADPSGDTTHFPVDPETLANLFGRYPETCPVQAREALGVVAGPRRFDTVIMGWRTFAPALEAGLADGAYPHLRQIVVTHQEAPAASSVEYFHGHVAEYVAELKKEPGRDIWLCGGGDLAGQLIDVVDEIQLKINPVVLGSGIALFGGRAKLGPATPAGFDVLPGGVTLATYQLGAAPE